MERKEALECLCDAISILVVDKGVGYYRNSTYPKFKVVAVFSNGYCLEIRIEDHPYYDDKDNLYHIGVPAIDPIFELFYRIDKEAYSKFSKKIYLV